MSNAYHWEGRAAAPGSPHIFIAIPCYDGKPEPQCWFALLESFKLLEAAGVGYDLVLETGNCHVDDARNGLVRLFMDTECTDLVFIDADVGFMPGDLLKLVRYDADLVVGIYPKKLDETEFPVWPLPGERWAREDGLVKIAGGPTGFMRIRRPAIEKLLEAHADRQFTGQKHKEGDRPYTILFERTYEDGHRWSGDYSFCRKWTALGGEVYVDPEMTFAHIGSKEWSGRLGDFWRKQAGEEPARFVQAIRRLKAGDPKPENFVTLFEAWGNQWAATPEFLISAYYMAKAAKGPVLETGSGITTLVMAAAGAKVVSLEHDLFWRKRVLDVLERCGLEADVRYVPLGMDGWYDEAPEGEFALFVCDGPPRNGDAYVRLPGFALPGVQNADWIVDDVVDVPGRASHVFGDARKFVVAPKPKAVDLDALADDMARMEAVAF